MKNCQFTLRSPSALSLACAAALASFSLNAAQAQALAQVQARGVELPAVVVTAANTAQLITDALPHTTVINQTDIVRSQAIDLTTLLARESGFQFTHSGGRGLTTGVSLRGAATLQVLLMVDGVPLTKQDASGGMSYEHQMLDQIDRVEIVRGNVSAIYGSGAIGGVIQIFTKSGSKPGASVTAEAGSRGSYKVSGNISNRFGVDGASKLAFGYANTKTKGFSAVNTQQNPGANPDDDGYTNQNWSLAVSHVIAKGHTLGLKTTHSKGKFDFDNQFDAPSDIHKGQTKLDTTSVFTENQITQNWLSKLSIAQSTDLNTNQGPVNYLGNANSAFKSKNKTVLWNNTIAINTDWTVTAGLEQQQQAAQVDDSYGGLYTKKRTVNALFAGALGQLGASTLQINARRDSTSGINAKSTAYLGYGYAINPNWKLTASASTAFNLAPLGYLFAPGFGNPLLLPETAKSKELGLQYTAGKTLLRGTYFSTRTDNQFEYVYNPDTFSGAFQNIKKTKNDGLEISYATQLGLTDIKASVTSQNPENVTTGKTSNRRAKTLAALSVSQPMGAWRLGADARFTGAVMDGSKALDSHTLLDLSARYTLSNTLSGYARVENLANAKYQTVYGYNGTPRGVFVGLNWQPSF